MTNGIGRVKKTVKRFGDTASEFETTPVTFLNRITRSQYSGRIILSLILASFAVGWWAAS